MTRDSSMSIDLNVRFRGGEADSHRLDLYDGTHSLFGFARTLLQSTHFFLNGNVTFQAPAAKGVRLYLRPAQKGSFSQVIQLVVDHPETAAFELATGVALWDFTKLMLSRTTGTVAQGSSPMVRSLQNTREPDLDALSEAITSPLKHAHRFIEEGNRDKSISLEMGSGSAVVLTSRSRDYLFVRSVGSKFEKIVGSVSSYNINTRYGRIFDNELGRTVPFKFLKEAQMIDKSPITWSLHQNERGASGSIVFLAKRETTVDGETTRYFVKEISVKS
jgi:hypothetical protein